MAIIVRLDPATNIVVSSPTVSVLGTDTHIQSSSNSTWTKSITVPSGTERVYVGFGQNGGGSPSAITLSGGGTGTLLVSLNGGVSGQPVSQWWRITNATVGAQVLQATVTGVGLGTLSIVYVRGIDTTTPEVSFNSVDSNTLQPALTMTTVAGGMVLDFGVNSVGISSGAGTPNGLQTEILDYYLFNASVHVSSYVASTSTSTNIGWTLTNANNTAYTAVALQPNRYQTPASLIQLGTIGSPITIR